MLAIKFLDIVKLLISKHTIMKSNLAKLLLIICAVLLSNRIIAQGEFSVSLFYKYGYKFDVPIHNYPIGFGGSISKHISKKIILTAGLESSHYSHDYQNKITPPTFRTEEVTKESVYALNIGLSYPILDQRFAVRIGSSILPSYFTSHWDYKRYLVSNDLLDLQLKDSHDYFGLGFCAKIDLVYSINQDISIFLQPGFTYYLAHIANGKFINGSAGIILNL